MTKWHEKPLPADLPLERFENLVVEMIDFKSTIDEEDSKVKAMKKELEAMKKVVMDYLEASEIDKYSSKLGTVYKENRFTVKTPKTPDDKMKLLNWLKEKGIYEQYATVNSQSLNSLYRSYLDEEGPGFMIPGCEEIGHITQLKIRRS